MLFCSTEKLCGEKLFGFSLSYHHYDSIFTFSEKECIIVKKRRLNLRFGRR